MFIENVSNDNIFFESNGIDLLPEKVVRLDSSFDKEFVKTLASEKKVILIQKKDVKKKMSVDVVEGALSVATILGTDNIKFAETCEEFGMSDFSTSVIINSFRCLGNNDIPIKVLREKDGFSKGFFDVNKGNFVFDEFKRLLISNYGVSLGVKNASVTKVGDFSASKEWRIMGSGHSQSWLSDGRASFSPDANVNRLLVCSTKECSVRGADYLKIDIDMEKPARVCLWINGVAFSSQYVESGRRFVCIDVSNVVLESVTEVRFDFYSDNNFVGDVTLGNIYSLSNVVYEDSGYFITSVTEKKKYNSIWCYLPFMESGKIKVEVSLDNGESFTELYYNDMGKWKRVVESGVASTEEIVYRVTFFKNNNESIKIKRFLMMSR